MARILVATSDGLHDVGPDRTTVELEGHAVGALLADGPERWAVVDRGQIWATSGEGWSPFVVVEQLHISCLSLTDRLLFGTSSARLFSVVDGQATPLDGFDRAEGRGDWYTPWGGPPDTRSISEWDRDVYVNVHVGGILRTSDGGASWTPTIDIDADVHRVATAEGLVLAACAGGLATSTDRGATWSMRDDGLAAPYMRGVTVCGDAVLVSTSNGPRGGRSGVYRGRAARRPRVRAVHRGTARMVRRQHRQPLPRRAPGRIVRGLRHRRRTGVRLRRRRRDVGRARVGPAGRARRARRALSHGLGRSIARDRRARRRRRRLFDAGAIRAAKGAGPVAAPVARVVAGPRDRTAPGSLRRRGLSHRTGAPRRTDRPQLASGVPRADRRPSGGAGQLLDVRPTRSRAGHWS